MDYKLITEKFIIGGPVKYQDQRGHIIAMNDINHTITVDVDGKPHTDVHYDEVSEYEG